jgi:hypothetical protein
VFDFLKLAGMWACPRVRGYPRIADTGVVSCLWRVAGAGAGTDFSMWVRVYKVNLRSDFTRCDLKAQLAQLLAPLPRPSQPARPFSSPSHAR